MTEINLLPWRELKREQDKKQFTTYLAAGMVIAAMLVFAINHYAVEKVDAQRFLNHRLETEITELKKQIVEIENLQALRQGLIARMNIVQNLQSTRTLTVRLFDELIKVLPDGVFITRMDRRGDKITLHGFTQSNTNISDLMRNIANSYWIQNPELTEIKKTKETINKDINVFKLSFILKPRSSAS